MNAERERILRCEFVLREVLAKRPVTREVVQHAAAMLELLARWRNDAIRREQEELAVTEGAPR